MLELYGQNRREDLNVGDLRLLFLFWQLRLQIQVSTIGRPHKRHCCVVRVMNYGCIDDLGTMLYEYLSTNKYNVSPIFPVVS